MASSMERVSLLLATGTGGEEGGSPISQPLPCLPRRPPPPSPRLTTAVGLVGLQHVGRVLGRPLADEVAVLVFVVAGGAHHHGALPGCLLLLPLGQLLRVQREARAQRPRLGVPGRGAPEPPGLLTFSLRFSSAFWGSHSSPRR